MPSNEVYSNPTMPREVNILKKVNQEKFSIRHEHWAGMFLDTMNGSSREFLPKGMLSRIFFSMSAPSLAVMSDAMKPGATAFT